MHIPQNEFQDCNGPYPVTSLWEPHNSTSNGTFDMYKATQLSVNTYFAQLERETGLCQPYAIAKSMGVELTDPATERVPSFTLGVADVSPLEMAGAYATLAARGLHCDNRPVTEILNSDGKVFKDYPKQCQQVIQQSTADTISDILKGVMAPGGFGQALTLDKPSAAKTGTIDNNAAVWFDGYTPEVATAAMIAGANSLGHPITLNGHTVGGRFIDVAHGSTVAGPMWAIAMRAIQDDIPYADFVPPGTTSNSANVGVPVPDVTGLSLSAAAQRLAGAGFYVSVGSRQPSNQPAGTVASTSPGAGASTPRGTTIYLYPSSGGGGGGAVTGGGTATGGGNGQGGNTHGPGHG